MAARCDCKPQSCRLCPSLEGGIFAGLSEKEHELLNQCKTDNRYKKGQVVFYEGNPVLGLCCIRSGKIKLFKSSPDGKQQILRIAKSGDVIGHSSLFSDERHGTTAEVIEEAEICFLDKQGLLAVVRRNSSVALHLLGRLGRELNRTEEKALDLAYKSVRVRFAELLLTLKETFGADGEGVCKLDISLSREEMAQAIGTTVETTVRLLTEFREQGFIEVKNRSISITNPAKLLELTGSGY